MIQSGIFQPVFSSIDQGKSTASTGDDQTPTLPVGEAFVIDDSGSYLLDEDGNYLTTEET